MCPSSETLRQWGAASFLASPNFVRPLRGMSNGQLQPNNPLSLFVQKIFNNLNYHKWLLDTAEHEHEKVRGSLLRSISPSETIVGFPTYGMPWSLIPTTQPHTSYRHREVSVRSRSWKMRFPILLRGYVQGAMLQNIGLFVHPVGGGWSLSDRRLTILQGQWDLTDVEMFCGVSAISVSCARDGHGLESKKARVRIYPHIPATRKQARSNTEPSHAKRTLVLQAGKVLLFYSEVLMILWWCLRINWLKCAALGWTRGGLFGVCVCIGPYTTDPKGKLASAQRQKIIGFQLRDMIIARSYPRDSYQNLAILYKSY